MRRSTAREIAVRLIFAISENPESYESVLAQVFEPEYYSTLESEDSLYKEKPNPKQLEYISRIVKGVVEHVVELDGYIEKYAVGWKFGRIPRTATSIMRTAMFEVLYMQDIPNSAAINDAVEIAKRYESPETVSFLNGVLGSFTRAEYSI
jgi:N utilization substance protein B